MRRFLPVLAARALGPLLAAQALLVGCGLASPGRGQVVAEGVARASFEVRANTTDLVTVTVVFPATGDGAPVGGAHPGVVYIQGGAVSPRRYEWQAVELAKRGYVVALPQHPLDLAFFAIDQGQAARRLLVEPPAGSLLVGLTDPDRLGVAGHSLGGVVAVKLALGGGFRAVVVQASFQDTADNAKLPALGMPSLYLAGQSDCMAKEQQVRDGWATAPAPSALVVLAGVTHFEFTDSEADDVARNCAPPTPLSIAHGRIVEATLAFFDAALTATPALGEARLRALPGAVVELR
jgi:predicted dienelactone hydrolase